MKDLATCCSNFLLISVICDCVTISLIPSCPGYSGNVWVGGRESVSDPSSDTEIWVWNRSGARIDQALWLSSQPGTDRDQDHAMLSTSDRGLDDDQGTNIRPFLCEIACSRIQVL